MDVALVVLPGDAELDDALGHGDHLQGGPVLRVALEQGVVLECEDELCWMGGRASRYQQSRRSMGLCVQIHVCARIHNTRDM